MILNSERHQSQVFIENLLGCSDPKNLKHFNTEIDGLILNDEAAFNLNEKIKIDIVALFEKALLAYASAINDIEISQKLWPVVKLYYATYYSVRAELLAKKIVVFRANKVFTIKPQKYQKFQKIKKNLIKSKKTSKKSKILLKFLKIKKKMKKN